MNFGRLTAVTALCGVFLLIDSVAPGRLGGGLPTLENIAASIGPSGPTRRPVDTDPIEVPQPAGMGEAYSDEAMETASAEPSSISRPTSSGAKVASTDTLDPVQGAAPKAALGSDKCLSEESCIDEYLWSVYQRAPKTDTVKVLDQIKVSVKEKGKTHTVTKSITKLVGEDFTWKDPNAAQRAGMSVKAYVIGGMDRGFKLMLYRALRAMDNAGLVPGITSAFRDDYRQSLATGNKAAIDSSFHGGSRRGGYGHGLAADIVSVKGETGAERVIASERLWQWIDEHGPEFGIARPYLDRDPPHVGPINGQEYVEKRGQGISVTTAFGNSMAHRKAAAEHVKMAATSPLQEAPIGYRQPKLRGVPEVHQLSGRDKKMRQLEEGLAHKLTGVCRGC